MYIKISEYELDKMFQQYLDDCYPMVKVGPYQYYTSETLKSVDEIAYRDEYLNYLDSLSQDDEIRLMYKDNSYWIQAR